MQLIHQSTAEDIEIAAVLEDIEVKLQNTLKTLELFQSKNADSIFNTGRFSRIVQYFSFLKCIHANHNFFFFLHTCDNCLQ